MKNFEFEAKFTVQEYQKFIAAVEKREKYEFSYGEFKAKMQVNINGIICDNGIWKPEDYFWSIDMTDKRNGFSGGGFPSKVSEMKTYEDIVNFVYEYFKLPYPAGFQQTFF